MKKAWHRFLGLLPHGIADWLRRDRGGVGGGAMATKPPRSPEAIPQARGSPSARGTPEEGSGDAVTLEQHVSRILSTNPVIQGGSVQLIGLDPLRDRLGPRWPALRNRIRGLA